MDSPLLEIRLVLRTLARTPGFTMTAVLSLAAGIGATVAVYSVIDATLLRPLPVAEPEGLFTLTYEWKRPDGQVMRLADLQYSAYRAVEQGARGVLSGVAAYDSGRITTLDTGRDVLDARVHPVSGEYFSTLGVRTPLGRPFSAADAAMPGANPVAVLSDACWRQQYGGDAGVVGRTVRLNHVPFTIVGVAPPRFSGLRIGAPPHVFIPITMAEEIWPENYFGDIVRRGSSPQSWVSIAGRLKPGVSPEQAEAALARILIQTRTTRVALVPAVVHAVGGREELRRFGFGLLAASGACLAIACVNLAGLLLARAEERRKDIGVRAALGAGATRLAVQPVIEGLCVATAGGVAGVLLARWILHATRAVTLPGGLTVGALDVVLDMRLLVAAMAAALATALVFGLLPAWHVWRTDVLSALRTKAAGGRRPSALRGPLLVAQLTLCVPVLAGTGLLVTSLRNALAIDRGFDMDGLVTVGISSRETKRADAALRALAERLRPRPGTEAVEVYHWTGSTPWLYIDGVGRKIPENAEEVLVGPDYFRALGLPIVRGRAIDHRDVAGATKTVVIDETLAAMLFPEEDPIGRRFAFRPPQPSPMADPVEVVGVARAARYDRIFRQPAPHLYAALAQQPEFARALVVRARGDLSALGHALRQEARALDPGLPPPRIRVMADRVHDQLAPQRLGATFLGFFGGIALGLTSIGLYGLLAYAVSLRRPEIGLRIAVGAERRHIVALVLRQGVRLIAVGLATGAILALSTARLLTGFLHGVEPRDPAMLLATSALVAGVGLLACYLPARRAARLDPVEALRCE